MLMALLRGSAYLDFVSQRLSSTQEQDVRQYFHQQRVLGSQSLQAQNRFFA
jgi:hypothetical protein